MPDAITNSQRLLAQLRFPCGDVPDPGVIKNVAPGIYWLRMPLPFQLNHINLWLIEEKDGWTIVDTGINTDDTRELWEKIFAEQLGGKPVIRVVATHLHPDHVGLAGWLCERWNAPLLMTLGEYMSARRRPQRLHRERGPARGPSAAQRRAGRQHPPVPPPQGRLRQGRGAAAAVLPAHDPCPSDHAGRPSLGRRSSVAAMRPSMPRCGAPSSTC